jgi:hypothetical protein
VTGFYKPEPIDSMYANGHRYLLDWTSYWYPCKESSLCLDDEVQTKFKDLRFGAF